MAIPNLKALVQSIYNAGDFDLSTLDGCGAYVRACAGPCHERDKRIVMLKKSAGRTHVVDAKGRRHAADALLFLDNGKGTSIDIIGSSRTPQAKPAWTPDKKVRYIAADGFAPDYENASEPEPDEPRPPTPPSSDLEARVTALEKWARSFPK